MVLAKTKPGLSTLHKQTSVIAHQGSKIALARAQNWISIALSALLTEKKLGNHKKSGTCLSLNLIPNVIFQGKKSGKFYKNHVEIFF